MVSGSPRSLRRAVHLLPGDVSSMAKKIAVRRTVELAGRMAFLFRRI